MNYLKKVGHLLLTKNAFHNLFKRLNYLEVIELVYSKVLNKEVQLDSFLRYLSTAYRNNLTDEEISFYYEQILEVFGSEVIYNKLEKINPFGTRLFIQPFNHNHLKPSVWWKQYYENKPNQKLPINRKLRPYATTYNWSWYITPREKSKGFYKKRYRQQLKKELNKELNEYLTNTYR